MALCCGLFRIESEARVGYLPGSHRRNLQVAGAMQEYGLPVAILIYDVN
jgi:hypothetical protein